VFAMGDGITSLAVLAQSRFGTPDPSPDVIKRMGKKVEAMLQELYDETWKLLEEHRDEVLSIAAALEDRKTISGNEIVEIMGSEPGSRAHTREGTWRTIDPGRALEANPVSDGGGGADANGSANGSVGGAAEEDVEIVERAAEE